MRAIPITILLMFLVTCVSSAQSVSTQMGAEALGMGNCSAIQSNAWASFNNPGGLSSVQNTSLIVAYESRRALPGSDRMGAAICLPIGKTVLALSAFKFGDKVYSEHLLSASAGYEIGKTSLGTRINYVQYRTSVYGTKTGFMFDFGGITQLTPMLSIGAYITNLTVSKLNSELREPLPTRMMLGLGFTPSESVMIACEAEKDLTKELPIIKAGLQYSFKKKFYLRTGFNLYPTSGFFGVGLHKQFININYALHFSPYLQDIHQASIGYAFMRRKKNKSP